MKTTIQAKNLYKKKKNNNNINNKIQRIPKFHNTVKSMNSKQKQTPYASFRMLCKNVPGFNKSQSVETKRRSNQNHSSLSKIYSQSKQNKFNNKMTLPHYFSTTQTPTLYLTQSNQDINSMNRSNFKFMYQIGFGGFGKVWKVQQKSTWQYFAMKQIQKRKVIEKDSVGCIMNQKKLLNHMNHPFLVNIKYAFQDKYCLYLIMDYLKGADLRYHICYRQHFSQIQTKFILACLILAVQQIHIKGIIHRDIKPQNLVLQQTGYVRLTDFGIAKHAKQLKIGKYDSSGTPGYMAPQVLFKEDYDQTSDFFAIGVIGYELMLNKRPYVGRNRKQIKQKVIQQQIQITDQQLPKNWSHQSASFINELILKNPNQRLGSSKGIKQLKQHPWMNDINWKKLLKKQIIPPFIPNIVCQTKQYLEQIQGYNQMNQQSDNQEKMKLNTQQNRMFLGYYLSLRCSPFSTPLENTRNTLNNCKQKQKARQRIYQKIKEKGKQKQRQKQMNKLKFSQDIGKQNNFLRIH